jgi:hypothetical protein
MLLQSFLGREHPQDVFLRVTSVLKESRLSREWAIAVPAVERVQSK